MAAAARLKLKQTPTDVWSNRERLCLASSVMRSGDQNWVSVSRAIKPFGEANRPTDWFSQKNCALQYSDLLEKVETPKRKRGERGEIETPGESIVRKLTAERVEELKKLIQQEQEQYRKMKREIYLVQSGQLDDKLNDLWAAVLEEKKKEEQAALNHQKWLKERESAKEAALAAMRMNKIPPKKVPIKYRLTSMRRNSSQSEQGSEPDSVADSPLSESLNIDTGVEEPQTPETPISQEIATPTTPKPSPTTQPTPTSPLLSSLLKSPTTAATQANLSLLQSLESPGRSTGVSSISTLLNASPTKSCLLNPPFSRSGDIENTPRPPTSSPSAGAPTLSKLLEMPLASPGKPLPPLPVITTEETHSKITEILSEALTKVEPVVTPSLVTPVVSSVVISETEKTSDKTVEIEESNMNIDSENVSLETTIPSEENVEDSQKTECKTEKEPEKPVPETKPLPVSSTEPLEEQTIKTEESTSEVETTAETMEVVEQTESVVEKEVPSADAEVPETQVEEKTEKLEEEVVEEVEEVIIETVTEEIIEPAAMAAEVEIVSEQEKEVTEATEDSEISKDATDSSAEQTSVPLPTEDTNEEKVEEKEVLPEEEKISEKPPIKPPEEIEESKTDIEECKSSPKSEDQTNQIKTNETVVDEEPKCDEKDETDEEKKTTTAVTDDISVTSSPSTPVSQSSGRGRGGRRRGRKPGSGRGGHHNQQSELPVSETPPVQPSPHNKTGRGRRHATQHPKEEKKEEKEEKKEEEPQKEETKEVKVKEKARSSRQSESNNDSQDKLPSAKAESVVSPKRIRGSREKEKRKVKEKKEKETPEETAKVQTKETTEEKEENISTSAENSLLEADDKVSEKDESSNLSKPALCDSIPNSPASTAQSDDQESLRDYKVWKKAIMLVWRSAANHKYANVFLHPVTEEVAPGYHSVVYRPMDLSQIKKNIENGVIKTTTEFQRDMMLMFQDAIMYNNSDHDVFHMAVEMQKEVVRHIQDFLATQLMVQTAEIPKALRRETREHALKRTSESQSEKQPEETKKTPQTPDSDGPPKPKKRR